MRLTKRTEKIESEVERPASEYAALRRWFGFKLMLANINGLPDRWFFRAKRQPCPHCGQAFEMLAVEFKRPGVEELRPDQVQRKADLAKVGVIVHVVNDLEVAKALLK
nr:MAG TPA_asm: hydrolase [Caudoviricetes sp.]